MIKQRDWLQPALQIFFRLSGWIGFPVVIGAILGKWLDKHYGTTPWLFLTTIGVAFLVSMFGLVTNALKEFKKIDKDSQNQTKINANQDKNK